MLAMKAHSFRNIRSTHSTNTKILLFDTKTNASGHILMHSLYLVLTYRDFKTFYVLLTFLNDEIIKITIVFC